MTLAEERAERLAKLGGWIVSRECQLAGNIVSRMQSMLIRAHDQKLLVTPHHETRRLLQRGKPPPSATENAFAVLGGAKHFHREKQTPAAHFERDDGAWFDFALVVLDDEVIAYNLELRLADTRWIRWDLNLPNHANDAVSLRSHCHPMGNNPKENRSHAIPFPRLSPLELLDFALFTGRDAEIRE